MLALERSLHQRLVDAALPRDRALVAPYVHRGTRAARRMVLIFVLLFAGLGLVMGVADAIHGATTVPMSLLKGMGYAALFSLFILGPVVGFWLFGRSRLTLLLRKGAMRPGTVIQRGEHHFRGSRIPFAEIGYADPAGIPRIAAFQGSGVEVLAEGDQVQVIADMTTSVAVLWPPDGLALARRK